MKTKFFFGAMAALTLAACSQDEVVDIHQDGIAYSVAVPTQTRAANSYCNNDLPGSFKVWALTNASELYINGDVIEKTETGWIDKSGTHYWPENKTLDFYAQVNGDNEFNLNNGAPSFNNFTVEDLVNKQVDLIYSVKKNQSKSSDGKVQLNFRHALSQVCFRAKNNTKTVQVTIKGVSVGHLTNTGSFTFPTANTDENYVHHNDNADTKTLNGGSWTLPANAQYNKQYDVTPLNGTETLAPGSGIVNLTCPGDDHKNTFAQVLTLLPQEVQAWDPTKKGTSKTDWNGAYFLVDLSLSNVTKGDNGTNVTTSLYTGKAAVPVAVDWEQGYRYIYTFVFDEGGNGGYTPDPENPQPVLTSIKYDVTVDDFIPVYPDGGNTGDGTHMDGDNDGSSYKYSSILSLHANNGTEEMKTVTLNSNDPTYSFTLASDYTPTYDGHTFLGWATTTDATTVAYAEGTSVSIDMTKDLDLYAVWEKVVTWKWIYHLNDGQEPNPNNAYFTTWTGYNSAWQDGVQRPLPNVKPVKEGYIFKGWAMSANGEVKYQAGDKVTLDENNPELNFYAVWEVATETIILSYNLEGGEGSIPNQSATVKSGEKATFTASTIRPTKEGQWIFLGWSYTSKGGEGTTDDVNVQAGESLEISQSTTLYAIYGKTTPTIGGGGSGSGWDNN